MDKLKFMFIHKTKLNNVYIIELDPRKDKRGYFIRLFAKEELKKLGISFNIVHINESKTLKKGTIRGLHLQKKPKQEDKIIRCLKGKIFDVAVDLRKNSPTYGQWISQILTEDNNKLFLVPKGFAHGFQALTNNCIIQYFVTQYYSPASERGVRWDDPLLSISWPIDNPILSDKDNSWPFL